MTQLVSLLARPGGLLLSTDLAAEYGLQVGQPLEISASGRRSTGFVAGLLQPADALSRRALRGLVLADIATAQEMTGQVGRLDRIDLILPPGDQAAAAVGQFLPPDAQLVPAGARTGALQQMTAAFRANLGPEPPCLAGGHVPDL